MFRIFVLPVLLSVLVFTGEVCAASTPPVISVVKKGAEKNSVSFDALKAPGPNGRLFVTTLQNDLRLAGWFDVSAAGRGGSVTLSGQVADAGNGIQSSFRVSWPGKAFDWTKVSTGREEIRRQAHTLADEMVRLIAGEKGIASTRIVFVNRRSANNADIYMCDADGHNMMQLTKDNVAAVGPRWAPNGKDIFYTSFVKGYPEIYRLIDFGRSRKSLAPFKGLNTGAAVSPDGGQIALILSYEGNPELYVLRVADGQLTRMTKSSQGVEASPCWSPDGRSIVYVSDVARTPQLYIVNVASRQSQRLTFRGSENVNPDWSAQGRIVYATKGAGGWQIATMDPSVGESSCVLVTTAGGYEHPSWAADGRHIVCGRSSALYILDTLGDPAVRLTNIPGNWMSPDWSGR